MPAPEDIGSLAIQEAAGHRGAPGVGGTPRWYRVGGLVAAVAAGLLVFTLVLPRIGQSDDAAAATSESSAQQQAIPRPAS